MNTKNIAIIALISTLITSTPCAAEKNNPITSMIYNNVTRARDWTSNFMYRCWNVGVLATLYATVGIYDIKKISGLDENKLKAYDNIPQLEAAKKRVEIMIQYGPSSANLNNFYSEIQGRIEQIKHDQQTTAQQE